MAEKGAIHIIRSVQKKWTVNALLSYFILASAITLLLIVSLTKFTGLSAWWSIPLLIVSFTAIFFIYHSWKVSEDDVARFFNERFPQLEESTGLLLKPFDSLNLLEKMQVKKIEQSITALPEPVSFSKKLLKPGLILLGVLVVSTALFFFPVQNLFLKNAMALGNKLDGAKPENVLPAISTVQVTIMPPAYTGNKTRAQSLFNIKAEEGANINWHLETNVPVNNIELIINGTGAVPLKPLNKEHTSWNIEKSFAASGFYQVKIDDKLSELYSIDLIKDAPPAVVIQKPKSYTVIDYGQPQQLAMTVSIEDDYGIREVDISATTTTGTGEGVKFKEHKLTFANFNSGARKYNLSKTLDLPALEMKPGDELYFYVRSVDNHNQESRSDVYMVSIPDTAELMSLDGLASSVNIKPEYFRSQRQIIIETEQLLKDQKTVTAEAFKDKSNDLGIDQKLLRMRYSKFLGEESDGPQEDDHTADDDHNDENAAADFGNAEKLMESVSHKHDNAEDANLFDAQVKKSLQDILEQMWNAETRLRTIKPQDALPFEYKALRLLKDLQQKGRSYVAKSSYKTTPLKPEKRLSGDLSKIEEPVTKTDIQKKENPEDEVRRAMGILENLKAGTGMDKTSLETLQHAALQLNHRASAEPAVFLTSVGAMNRVLEASGNASAYSALDLTAAQKGLQKLVKAPSALPSPTSKNPDQNLSQQYFKSLHQLNR